MVKTVKTADLDAIDRLEQKVKLLVDVVGQLRAEQTQMKEDNQRLTRELEATQEKLAEADNALLEERESIRSRVTDMLQQLDALAL